MKQIWRILAALLSISAFASGLSAQPVISAVLNAASYEALVSPGCLIAIFGSNLADASATAPGVPLPTALGGVSVSVAGLAAPLLYVSPSQINALIPFEAAIPASTVVPVMVTSPGGTITYNIRLTRNAPGIFTRNGAGTGRSFLFNTKFQPVETIAPQDIVIFYATGLGLTDSTDRVMEDVEVYIGERKAQVLFAGRAPGFPGVYQLNVIPPVPATDRLYLRSGGWQSNIADVGIRAGANTTNVTGTIDGLYPSSDPFFTLPPCIGDEPAGPCSIGQAFSIMLHAGRFSVSFDIVPSAKPFDVGAVGVGGGAIISIDPSSGTYTATVSTVSPAAASADFSQFMPPVVFYGSCNALTAVCPITGIPPPLTDPLFQTARMLPVPATTTPTSPNAIVQFSGSLSGSRFIVDGQNNTAFSKFGGFVQVPYGPFDLRVSTFQLYVDGKLVASNNLPFRVFHR